MWRWASFLLHFVLDSKCYFLINIIKMNYVYFLFIMWQNTWARSLHGRATSTWPLWTSELPAPGWTLRSEQWWGWASSRATPCLLSRMVLMVWLKDRYLFIVNICASDIYKKREGKKSINLVYKALFIQWRVTQGALVSLKKDRL